MSGLKNFFLKEISLNLKNFRLYSNKEAREGSSFYFHVYTNDNLNSLHSSK